MEKTTKDNKKTTVKSIVKNCINVLCLIILSFVFLTNLGAVKSFFTKDTPTAPVAPTPVVPVTYDLEPEVLNALEIAHNTAYDCVDAELDSWINEMLDRVDENFLDEYFSFMQVKKREILSLYNTVVHFFNKNAETAEEAAIRELEEEIERKVIKPEIAQARIDNITRKAIDVYVTTLDAQLLKVKESYKVPNVEWNRYISDICGLTLDIENRNYPITFKTMVVSGAAITGYAVAPVVKNVATKVSTKIAEKTALKTGTKIAEKTVAKASTTTVAKSVGKFGKAIPYIGWGVTAAICIWDIADYANTASEGKELLKQSLAQYFQEVKTELLCSTDQSIMGSIINWENDVKTNIVN